jgi:hypothetical protein
MDEKAGFHPKETNSTLLKTQHPEHASGVNEQES